MASTGEGGVTTRGSGCRWPRTRGGPPCAVDVTLKIAGAVPSAAEFPSLPQEARENPDAAAVVPSARTRRNVSAVTGLSIRTRSVRRSSRRRLRERERSHGAVGGYRRACFDDGTPLGSKENAECRIRRRRFGSASGTSVSELAVVGSGPPQSDARIDHAPDCRPARQAPLTTVFTASSKRSAKRTSGSRSTSALHVPAYSPLLPDTAARQAPVHPFGDFAADHAPRLTIVPFSSMRVHVPVTAPVFGSGVAVQVPPSVRPARFDALQEPRAVSRPAVPCGTAACARHPSMATKNSSEMTSRGVRRTCHLQRDEPSGPESNGRTRLYRTSSHASIRTGPTPHFHRRTNADSK